MVLVVVGDHHPLESRLVEPAGQLSRDGGESGVHEHPTHDVRAHLVAEGAADGGGEAEPGDIAMRFERQHEAEFNRMTAATRVYFGGRRGPRFRGTDDSARPQRPGAPLFSRCDLMIEALKEKLEAELQRLQHELTVVLPAEIRRAVELGDLRENSEYKSALERQQFVQARLGQLRQRLSKLSQIDITQIPTDKVGLGSKVVVVDVKTNANEVYHLVFGDAIEYEDGHVTMSSVIGRALQGKGGGRRRDAAPAREHPPAEDRRAADDPLRGEEVAHSTRNMRPASRP